MKVGYTNPSAIVTTSRKPASNVQFGTNFGQKKQEFKKAMDDEDKRYNFLVAAGGLLVLAGLGMGLIYKDKVLSMFEKNKKVLKKYLRPEMKIRRTFVRAYGGPDIDMNKGKTAIHDAWTNYINDYVTKRKQNNQIHKYYKEVLNLPENVAKLAEYEERIWRNAVK